MASFGGDTIRISGWAWSSQELESYRAGSNSLVKKINHDANFVRFDRDRRPDLVMQQYGAA